MAKKVNGKQVTSAVGIVGALATIVSVWWFALRPRRKYKD